jgi:catechol 2,3-dioxygenase-like lactoylglutathione lyase family enzyme
MKVLSLNWLGVRTEKLQAMNTFFQDVLNLEVIDVDRSGSRFRLVDGSEAHVYGADDDDHVFFGAGPVVGFEVESLADAHRALKEAGIEFMYPEPQREGGQAWQHFRAPDGNVYVEVGVRVT